MSGGKWHKRFQQSQDKKRQYPFRKRLQRLLTTTSITTLFLLSATHVALADGWDPTTKASNRNSIFDTRHNLTQSFSFDPAVAGDANPMDPWRNNYTEVCVYCHTPHGANSQINAPIWNRTINTGQYQIYDKDRTLDRHITQPGPNSLTCLSCHDGTISIDSIINMPGSGGYGGDRGQETTVNTAFLDEWRTYANGNQGGVGGNQGHFVLGSDPYTYDPNNAQNRANQCVFCHQANGGPTGVTPDYTVFALGTDLRNDHPIGIEFPWDIVGRADVDFNKPGLEYTPVTSNGVRMLVFDKNGNGWPDKEEPRLYDSGGPDSFEVECASCHDPHGVPLGNAIGNEFIPSFLRVSNGNATTGEVPDGPSGLCLTCHLK